MTTILKLIIEILKMMKVNKKMEAIVHTLEKTIKKE
jgi:hypothetical protein